MQNRGEGGDVSRLDPPEVPEPEHFQPTGTLFLLGAFVATLILLWLSVYLILLARGATS